MASPRLTFRHVNTPSKQKRESVQTPSKRAKFRQLFDEPDNENVLSEKISAVKCTFLQETEVQDPSILIASLVCTYGFIFAARLLGAICHVPNFFIERYQYIFKIVNCDGNYLSLTLVEKYVRSLQAYAKNRGYEVDRKTLWSCTNKYNEGFLVFLMPPVNECLQCSGTLYPLNKVQVTVFTLTGPMPGMKTTTRCKKGCGAIYNVDRYSCPGKGTFYYSEKQPVISSSNCVYLTRDVHELLCESGNHAFVSHHAFSEIYNSLFSNCVHTKEFRNWLISRKDECSGEVQHPSDTMYTAIVRRDDGVQSTGYFAIGDIYKGKDLATALNKTTKDGGNICLLQNNDLARLVKALIKDLKARCPVYRRELVTVCGLQEGSKVMVINPEQVIFVETGELADIEETSYVSMGKRRPHMERSVETPTSVLPLGLFLDTALRVLGRKTFGVALLAWCSMYSLNIYGWILRHLRHFNLPMLFGEPMVGKSLIASCAAWMNGCPKTAIVSRYFSRLVVLYVERSHKTKIGGDAMVLEQQAKAASAALPLVMQVLTTKLDVADVHHECQRLKVLLPAEMRILEGIALNVYITRQILNLADRYGYMKLVHEYVDGTMIPYYRRHLTGGTTLPEPLTAAPNSDIETVLYIEKITIETAALIKSGSVLAVDQSVIRKADSIGTYGAVRNKPTKVNGRTKKMAHFPTKNLPAGIVKEIQERLAPCTTSQPEPLPKSPSPPSPIISEQQERLAPNTTSQPEPLPKSPSPPSPIISEIQECLAPNTTLQPEPLPKSPSPPSPARNQSQTPAPVIQEMPSPRPSTVQNDQRCSPIPDDTVRPLQATNSQSNTPAVKLITRKRKCDMLLLPTEVSADELCQKCQKKGRGGMRWVECELCKSWYHATCMEIGRTQYMKIQRNQTTWECC